MGFGAINIDREVILNQEIVSQGLVMEPEIGQIADSVYREVLRRDRVYRKNRPFPELEGRHAIIVDDGLATGYTMLAAVRFARGRKAHKITVAVPVAHEEAYGMIKRESDSIICIYIDHGYMFAVANFYDDFSDMSEEEIIGILEGVKAGR
jgi:putative phosphoribosyl transferase